MGAEVSGDHETLTVVTVRLRKAICPPFVQAMRRSHGYYAVKTEAGATSGWAITYKCFPLRNEPDTTNQNTTDEIKA